MKHEDLKYILFLVGLGASLVVYGHTTFATKDRVKDNTEILKVIDQRVYDIHKKIISTKE